MFRKHWIVLFTFAAGILACSKSEKEQVAVFVGFQQPTSFPVPVYDFASNPVTKEGFELGRKLFYDPILSADNTISCGSCHIQTSAFTHNGHSVSHGIANRLGTRNSPPIMNLAWGRTFMWDGGIFNLDLQPLAPVTNHVEMDETMGHVLTKLGNTAKYPSLFETAFGSSQITSANFLKALSQFMVMCVSSNARYDSMMRQQITFSADEQAGYLLFQQKCGSCHKEPLFTDNSFRNNGLGITARNDHGRYMVTLNDTDKYRFKVPTLRNVQFTAPYMHDGRFFTLDAVLDHYTQQVQNTPNLDTLLHQNNQFGIPLNTVERQQIMAFLHTLSDRTFLLDSRFSEQ